MSVGDIKIFTNSVELFMNRLFTSSYTKMRLSDVKRGINVINVMFLLSSYLRVTRHCVVEDMKLSKT